MFVDRSVLIDAVWLQSDSRVKCLVRDIILVFGFGFATAVCAKIKLEIGTFLDRMLPNPFTFLTLIKHIFIPIFFLFSQIFVCLPEVSFHLLS